MVLKMSDDKTMIEREKPISPDIVEEERRKRLSLAVSSSLIDVIDNFRSDYLIVNENGKERTCPRSYIIEDMMIYLLSDDKRFKDFVKWFEDIEGFTDEEDVENGKEKE